MHSKKSLVIVVLFFSAIMEASQQPKPLSVCDVAANPREYDGKVVTITGELVASADETDFDTLMPLKGETCARVVRNRTIHVTGTEMSSPPKGWEVDIDSLDRAGKALEGFLKEDPKLRRVIVTVKGAIIYNGQRPRVRVTTDPWYPTEIVISTFVDIRKP